MLRLDRVCFLYFIFTALLRSHFICSFTHPSVTITFENEDLLSDVLYHRIDENDKGVIPDCEKMFNVSGKRIVGL